jgi:hypothetical protein
VNLTNCQNSKPVAMHRALPSPSGRGIEGEGQTSVCRFRSLGGPQRAASPSPVMPQEVGRDLPSRRIERPHAWPRPQNAYTRAPRAGARGVRRSRKRHAECLGKARVKMRTFCIRFQGRISKHTALQPLTNPTSANVCISILHWFSTVPVRYGCRLRLPVQTAIPLTYVQQRNQR